MFFHNLKYALKTLFKNKMLIFWTYAFPIVLGTFFYMAFSNIENSEKLDCIDIAIVETDEWEKNEIFKSSFYSLSDKEMEEPLFHISYVTIKEAQDLLAENEIVGYVHLTDTLNVVVNTNGIQETILKYVTEEIEQTEKIMNNVMEKKIQENLLNGNSSDFNAEKIYQEVKDLLEQEITIENTSSNNLSYTMIEFYTLIAMACLYSGILGMVAVNQNLANMSNNGKRIAISPVSKGKLIFTSVLAGYITQIIGIALLFLYTYFVLHVDYGNNWPYIILLTLVGCLAGLSLGVMIATLLKTTENVKTGIVISVTMLGCFLSGMMGITMKYIIDKNLPILNKINPANMITDGFYSLYYYDTFNRFYFNVISLLLFALIMLGISIFCLRRQQYDSI